VTWVRLGDKYLYMVQCSHFAIYLQKFIIKLVEIWRSSDRNKTAQFFLDTVLWIIGSPHWLISRCGFVWTTERCLRDICKDALSLRQVVDADQLEYRRETQRGWRAGIHMTGPEWLRMTSFTRVYISLTVSPVTIAEIEQTFHSPSTTDRLYRAYWVKINQHN